MASSRLSERAHGRGDGRHERRGGRSDWIAREILPHEPAVRRWLSRRIGCPVIAEDVLHEAYLRLAQAARVSHVRCPRTYLWRTIRSVIAQQARRGRLVAMAPLEEAAEMACGAPAPDAQAEASDELARVIAALEMLPETTRRILLLRRIEGLSQKATAARLALSESSVEKHQRRGHLALLRCIGRSA